MRKIRVLVAFVLAAMLAGIPVSHAAEYPTRAIKFVVPYVAGGPTDAQARMFGEYLTRDLKQSVFVENKGGAQGAIGAEAIAHGDADGYSLLFTTSSVIELNPVLYKKLSYDPDRELKMLGILTEVPMIMIVHPSVPAKTITEFIDYAKKNPGKLNFGSPGNGSIGQLAGEMFKQQAGIEMTHVPYKGAGAALTDLLSGQIQVMFESVGISLPPAQANLVRPLGVTATQRIAELPDLPTIAESGYPSYRVTVWYGVAAPTAMPAEAAKKISASIDRALNDETFRASLTKAGFPPLKPQSEAATREFVDADKARWLGVLKQMNFTLD